MENINEKWKIFYAVLALMHVGSSVNAMNTKPGMSSRASNPNAFNNNSHILTNNVSNTSSPTTSSSSRRSSISSLYSEIFDFDTDSDLQELSTMSDSGYDSDTEYYIVNLRRLVNIRFYDNPNHHQGETIQQNSSYGHQDRFLRQGVNQSDQQQIYLDEDQRSDNRQENIQVALNNQQVGTPSNQQGQQNRDTEKQTKLKEEKQ